MTDVRLPAIGDGSTFGNVHHAVAAVGGTAQRVVTQRETGADLQQRSRAIHIDGTNPTSKGARLKLICQLNDPAIGDVENARRAAVAITNVHGLGFDSRSGVLNDHVTIATSDVAHNDAGFCEDDVVVVWVTLDGGEDATIGDFERRAV